MILIFGGAYQGKLEFAKETFGLTEEDIHICGNGEIDFSKRCIYAVEEFTWNHPDPAAYFRQPDHKADADASAPRHGTQRRHRRGSVPGWGG